MPIFTETQHLRGQPILLVAAGAMVVFGWGLFVQQIVRGKPLGDEPLPDWGVLLVTALIGVALPALFLSMKMTTQVYPDRLEIRMAPFVNRTFRPADISNATARTYRPVREYGGWGIRGWKSNRAYNISGDQGVQLVLTSGDRVLIGTQRPQELQAAIASILPA
jgi:hypothetical protein